MNSPANIEALRHQLTTRTANQSRHQKKGPLAGHKANANPSPEEAQKLKQVGTDIESLFLNHLLKQMRATIPKSGLMGKSMATDLFRSMLDTKMAEILAARGTLGLGQMVTRQLASSGDMKEGPTDVPYKNVKEFNQPNR